MGTYALPVVVRLARRGEGEALAALMFRSKAYWGYDDAFLEACRPALVVPEVMIAAGDVFVAEIDGTLAGVASLLGAAPEIELDVCFVEPAMIGRGVGRVLVDAARAEARTRGATTMLVQADPHAEAFYERLGAVRVGEVMSDVAPDRPLPLLRFDLTA